MPELPEVETIRRGLLPKLVGQQFVKVERLWSKSFHGPTNKLMGQKVTDVERRGKILIIRLSHTYSLLIHLKMTGQLILIETAGKRYGGGHPTKSLVEKLPDSSTRLIFTLKSGDRLYFNDQRKFGWVKLVPNDEVDKDVLIARLGPEPLSSEFLLTDFRRALGRRQAPIKAILLDQSTLAGLGNIYVDEALHLAKIHPLQPASSLKTKQIEALYNSIIQVLNLALKQGGTTLTNFVNINGVSGNYLEYARAFRREGQPCPVCGRPISKIRVAGRGTHVCPNCQRLVKTRAKP